MDKYAARTRDISIHAPRKGSDGTSLMLARPLWYFYPRSPRGERPDKCPIFPAVHHFYPRSPRGERPARHSWPGRSGCISIHAPREGSDDSRPRWYKDESEISIHAPREGSDLHEKQTAPPWDISIHAPREGSDG